MVNVHPPIPAGDSLVNYLHAYLSRHLSAVFKRSGWVSRQKTLGQ